MPNHQKFIGNVEALIELLNDMLNDASWVRVPPGPSFPDSVKAAHRTLIPGV